MSHSTFLIPIQPVHNSRQVSGAVTISCGYGSTTIPAVTYKPYTPLPQGALDCPDKIDGCVPKFLDRDFCAIFLFMFFGVACFIGGSSASVHDTSAQIAYIAGGILCGASILTCVRNHWCPEFGRC